jgi:hypothetical protein
MAKNKVLKRIVTSSGQVRYYSDGKRLKDKTGKSKFVKQNPDLPFQDYTKGEQRSLRALQTYNDKFKFQGEFVKKIYIELLSKMGFDKAMKKLKKQKNKDLSQLKDAKGKKVFPKGYFEEVLRTIDARAKKDKSFFEFATKKGMPDYRGRDYETFKDNKVQSVIDFIELMRSDDFKSYNLEVTDMQGDAHYGRTAGLLAVRDFEIEVGDRVKSVANNIALIQFNYNFRLDIKNKTILLDLREKTGYQTESLELQVLRLQSENSTNEKDKPEINNLFNDVEITLMFS